MNKDASNYIFSTEGHIFKLDNLYRGSSNGLKNKKPREWRAVESVTISDAYNISQVGLFHEFIVSSPSIGRGPSG